MYYSYKILLIYILEYRDPSEETIFWIIDCKTNFNIHETEMAIRSEWWREEHDSWKMFQK